MLLHPNTALGQLSSLLVVGAYPLFNGLQIMRWPSYLQFPKDALARLSPQAVDFVRRWARGVVNEGEGEELYSTHRAAHTHTVFAGSAGLYVMQRTG